MHGAGGRVAVEEVDLAEARAGVGRRCRDRDAGADLRAVGGDGEPKLAGAAPSAEIVT